MILRDRCNTSCDLALLWRGRRNGPDKSLNALVRGRHSALNIACLKEFSQNCFDVVKFKNEASLVELQLQLRYIKLHQLPYTMLHYTMLHYTTKH